MRKIDFFSIFSVLVALMVMAASGYGLYHPDLYSGNDFSFLRLIANQDLIMLLVYVPILLIVTWLTARKSFRAVLIWLGVMGYFCYVYTGYAFGGVSGKILLLHIAIAAASFFLFLTKLAMIDIEEFRLRFEVTSFWFTAFFMIAVALLTETLWLQRYINTLSGPIIEFWMLNLKSVSAVKVLDLAFLGPLCFLAGFWLSARKAIGYVLTTALLVIIPAKFGTLLTEFNLISNPTQPNLLFGAVALVALILLINFQKKLKEEKLTNYHERISNYF
ncbi:MAG: hypothetical protein GXY86_00390 [Firmicutes bacterium]|nr:hypothetical protein [Bacillota bacterium]